MPQTFRKGSRHSHTFTSVNTLLDVYRSPCNSGDLDNVLKGVLVTYH